MLNTFCSNTFSTKKSHKIHSTKESIKFLTDPETLVAWLFKARYFPNNTYFTASIGHNPSYVWRSILRARFIVCGDARWRIGAGDSIPILGEPWLLNGECIDPNIVGAQYVRHVTIDNLMIPNDKRWNVLVVRQVFSGDLADKIRSTPIIAVGTLS